MGMMVIPIAVITKLRVKEKLSAFLIISAHPRCTCISGRVIVRPLTSEFQVISTPLIFPLLLTFYYFGKCRLSPEGNKCRPRRYEL